MLMYDQNIMIYQDPSQRNSAVSLVCNVNPGLIDPGWLIVVVINGCWNGTSPIKQA